MSPTPRGSRGCHGRGSAVAGVASVILRGRDRGSRRGYSEKGSASASASVNRGKLRKGRRDDDGDDDVKKAIAASASDMKAMYSLLRSMVPGITPKASRENILIETTEYIKLLEKERARLENLKRTLDQLKRTDCASFLADCSSNSSIKIQFEASSNITSFQIEAPIGESSLFDIFHAIHQGGAEIITANIATREGRKRIAVTAIMGGEDSVTAA